MQECYHQDVFFEDEAFTLSGKEVSAMWHMLCIRGKDLNLTYSDIEANEESGTAHWEAAYSFSKTGRQVLNKIDTRFKFKDNKIIEHIDSFNFWTWSKQALGTPGLLLGWSGFLKNKVREQAAESLNAFISKHPEYQ